MGNKEKYVVLSLELHIFFARIMKEHSLFLEAGFTPRNAELSRQAERFKNEFEDLLMCTVKLSDGIISQDVLCSGEIFTEFTDRAERQTQQFTGIQINSAITRMQARLTCGENPRICSSLVQQVRRLNQKALRLVNGLIAFKERVLNAVLNCNIFTVNYPLLIEHILREARLYRTYILCIESGNACECQTMRQIERFWNQIMMEHALFIRGLLDPTEKDLICAADDFADDYARLLNCSRETNDTAASLDETLKFRDFKAAGTKGIQNCEIRSVILPLLADHVLREANHYIRLLND
ncbi:MAG: DUF2935 domain-containing protein [Oscillospiraceae bacterium]